MTNQASNANSPGVVIFFHIPKTAGTTFYDVSARQYGNIGIYYFENFYWKKSLDELKRLVDRIKLVRGHMALGLHEYFPDPCIYVTLLRNPVDRVISSYYHFLRSPPRRDAVSIAQYESVKNLNLKEFVSSAVSTAEHNRYVKMLSGEETFGTLFKCTYCYDDMLERAKQNLGKHFSLVGIAERFDETLLLCKRILGWKRVYYRNRNVAGDRPPIDAVPKDVLDNIAEHNAYDMRLYEYATKIFDDLVSRQGTLFNVELKAFKTLNRFFGNRN